MPGAAMNDLSEMTGEDQAFQFYFRPRLFCSSGLDPLTFKSMTKYFIPLTVFTISLILLTATAGAAQNVADYKELPNFQVVSESLYRGGQPKSGGFRRLAELGIKTVVNLRAADNNARKDQALAEATGLRFFNVPLPGHARPTDEQVGRVLSVINAPENYPVFIYCRRGSDRTGTITAIYRISHDGWTSTEALSEANRRGMFPTQFEMKDYIRDFYCGRTGVVCEDRRVVDKVGLPAAQITRRIFEEVSEHLGVRKSFRQIRKLFR
jgi:protein tyrosine phosphatase (PTP) superfamily phosphohydrolase (DUF442 family)